MIQGTDHPRRLAPRPELRYRRDGTLKPSACLRIPARAGHDYLLIWVIETLLIALQRPPSVELTVCVTLA